MKKLLLHTLLLLLVGYVLICLLLFFLQEKLLFFPDKLSRNYAFHFEGKFEELFIPAPDGKLLNGLLFAADSSRGLVFYLHGNAGALDSWGEVAGTYTALHYDVFMLDYRGYGKSEGTIRSQRQLFADVQAAYDRLKERYPEEGIVVMGYSLGTGVAAQLASANRPRLLVLQAPFYSMTDLAKHLYPHIPSFLLRYPLPTAEYLKNCLVPVVLFHGDRDEVVYYGSSVKLKGVLKPTDTLITLRGQGHNGITDNPGYLRAIARLLAR